MFKVYLTLSDWALALAKLSRRFGWRSLAGKFMLADAKFIRSAIKAI